MSKERYKYSLIICTLLGTSSFASAWKIPEQSAQSIALAGAYVSASKGAQSSYYNPANMSFNENKNEMDFSLIGVYLNSVNYKDNTSSNKDANSEIERILIPGFFYTSKEANGFRFGLSSTAPGGLTKRWNDLYPKTFAEKFSLKIVELNPVISYKLTENLSIAGGFRTLYSQGVVKSDGKLYGTCL